MNKIQLKKLIKEQITNQLNDVIDYRNASDKYQLHNIISKHFKKLYKDTTTFFERLEPNSSKYFSMKPTYDIYGFAIILNIPHYAANNDNILYKYFKNTYINDFSFIVITIDRDNKFRITINNSKYYYEDTSGSYNNTLFITT